VEEDLGYGMPNAGCQMPDAGYQMPDIRCQMPDASYQKYHIAN